MTAILLSPAQFEGLRVAILADYRQRGLDPYWLPMPVAVTGGEHAGMMAVDVGEDALAMDMIGGKTLRELPEYASILAALGNPDHVELAADALRQPEKSVLPLPGTL